MKLKLLSIASVSVLFGCGKAPEVPPAPTAPALVSGIDIQFFDASVPPQDDFYKHINGKWLADTQIPPDKGSYGSFMKLRDDSEAKLHAIIDDLRLDLGGRISTDEKTIDRAVLPVNGGPAIIDGNNTFTETKGTYKAGLDYTITPDVMAYVSNSTGYRPGSFSST